MSMQNLWYSKSKNSTKLYVLLLYKWYFFYLWCLDMKYILFTFEVKLCNYHDVILGFLMRFLCIKQEHSSMSFKNNISFVWLFKKPNTCKYHSHWP
jgi:hypothetical protein